MTFSVDGRQCSTRKTWIHNRSKPTMGEAAEEMDGAVSLGDFRGVLVKVVNRKSPVDRIMLASSRVDFCLGSRCVHLGKLNV